MTTEPKAWLHVHRRGNHEEWSVEECMNTWSTHTRLPIEKVTAQVKLLEKLHEKGAFFVGVDRS